MLVAGALLHDSGIVDGKFEGKFNGKLRSELEHSVAGINFAKKLLPAIKFPSEKIDAVLEVIRLHDSFPWSREYEPAKTIEVALVQDADRLDGIGAVGIARMCLFMGSQRFPLLLPEVPCGSYKLAGRPNISVVHNFYDHLLKIKTAINTPKARKLAEKRTRFMEHYLNNLLDELSFNSGREIA